MINYLKYLDCKIRKNEKNHFGAFTEEANIPLEIHFSFCVSSLEGFFKSLERYLNSIDFSNFDSTCFSDEASN